MAEYRLGVDIGGTFTDIVLLGSDGTLWSKKILSTPDDYSRAIEDGIRTLLDESRILTAEITEFAPGTTIATRPVRMHFGYDAEFGAYTPEAYERLLLEAMAGDATLFIRRDEVETAWQFVDAIRAGWGDEPLSNREFYAAGTWGPEAAEDLLAQDDHVWHNPQPAK